MPKTQQILIGAFAALAWILSVFVGNADAQVLEERNTLNQEEHDDELDAIFERFYSWVLGDTERMHRVALGWNWDAGEDILWRIINDPNCDVGTALYILSIGEAATYMGAEKEKYSPFTWELHAQILDNFQKEFYTLRTYAFVVPTYKGERIDGLVSYDEALRRYQVGELKRPFPREYFDGVVGVSLSYDPWVGMPESVWIEIYDLNDLLE